MKTFRLIAITGALLTTAASAQTADPAAAYIEAGFAKMDLNGDAKVDRNEFDRFMRARLAKQQQRFQKVFTSIDRNRDGRISKTEAAGLPQLGTNFDIVDDNGDGSIDMNELRSAAARAQMQEAGLTAE